MTWLIGEEILSRIDHNLLKSVPIAHKELNPLLPIVLKLSQLSKRKARYWRYEAQLTQKRSTKRMLQKGAPRNRRALRALLNTANTEARFTRCKAYRFVDQ